jgi:hypothetical protein
MKFFVFRTLVAWCVLLFVVLVVWSGMIGAPEWIWALAAFITLVTVTLRVVSHVRRVRLVGHRPEPDAFDSRHRRQLEVPFRAEEAFAIVEGAVRELPYVESVESAPDSLQLHARVKRMDPYAAGKHGRKQARGPAGARRNLVHATVTPGERTASITVTCEPEGGAWVDWLLVDDGTNLENMEAIVRAITRRVSEARKAEETRARETATEKELTVARLNLLHAQVEPHFLYNTLASAQLLTRSDPAKADEMLGHLITYLRRSVPRAEESMSSVGEELERAHAYLEILRIRMGERLTLNLQVPDRLKPVPLPAMMVQTLAENAIKHGLEPMPGGGSIWIFARENAGRVSVTVADDGRGFSEESAGTGIGLRNLRERLKLAYGDEASFSIVSNFPRGVAATITVPAAGPSGLGRA